MLVEHVWVPSTFSCLTHCFIDVLVEGEFMLSIIEPLHDRATTFYYSVHEVIFICFRLRLQYLHLCPICLQCIDDTRKGQLDKGQL